jgi:hypothetical protein
VKHLRLKIAISVLNSLFFLGCGSNNQKTIVVYSQQPTKILWAWERPEDLRFLDTKEFGVAFLAQTLYLQNDDVEFRPRRQSLELAKGTYLIAVTRIETKKDKTRPTFSAEQKKRIVSLVKNTLELPDVKAVQIDFDVVASERSFYREVILDLKKELPENTPFSITSLASWCVGDTWFKDLPIDEAVPMAFQMGADDKAIRDFLQKGNDWNEPLCRGSYGIALDEPLKVEFKPNRRFFYFSQKPWRASDIESLQN